MSIDIDQGFDNYFATKFPREARIVNNPRTHLAREVWADAIEWACAQVEIAHSAKRARKNNSRILRFPKS